MATLQRELGPRRAELLAARAQRQRELSAGATLDFLPQTEAIREDTAWRVAPPAPGLVDRRVEITGPTDRKMTINALNSGAKVWLADFEDANTPLWDNMVTGQLNLKDALDRTIDFTSEEGKSYWLRPDDELATIVVRPRGWHLDEKHLLVDGQRVSGSLFDFGLYFTHCALRQLRQGQGPLLLPGQDGEPPGGPAVERRLPAGPGRARPAARHDPGHGADRDHPGGVRDGGDPLRAARAQRRAERRPLGLPVQHHQEVPDQGPEFVLPERNSVTMTAPFMRAYTELLVKTCHGRGAHAMGGMAAFIPSRRDPEVNEKALAKVRDDKTRESRDGFDGSWVAHPDLVPVCREVFDGVLGDAPNQLGKLREDVAVSAADLLAIDQTPGAITEAGLRNNVSVGLQYLANWLAGNGAVAIFNLMEDAATAEISRSQVWQWLHNDITLDDGPEVTTELVEQIIAEELATIREQAGAGVRRGPATTRRWRCSRRSRWPTTTSTS